MKSIIAIIMLSVLLASCSKVTQQEIDYMKHICSSGSRDVRISQDGSDVYCVDREDKMENVKMCINKYIDAIDEKYNNPDTVSNLAEDDYSKVVKTCNETFGETLSGSTKQ